MSPPKKRYRMIGIAITLAVAIAVGLLAGTALRSFGRLPRGERKARIERSPNYRDGRFRNQLPTPTTTQDKGMLRNILDFLFARNPHVKPDRPLPAVKTNLHALDRDEDVLVWFGHSSYLIQVDGRRYLIDPVLTDCWPMSMMFRPFEGTDIYRPEDIPEIDCLIISHDHWDHLDYHTVTALRDRIGQVVCALGVGEHFEYWGFDPARIVELDWHQSAALAGGATVNCLPARHFAGRGLRSGQSLWASYMLSTPSMTIYIGGDTGYDDHFAEVGRQFPAIDLAILENGQYDADWRYIHTMPGQLVQAIADLRPQRVLTVHNSKFALCKHAWNEPLNNIAKAAESEGFDLLTPMIGEQVRLKDTTQTFSKWWIGPESE